jgi:hypothetical protein
MACKLFLAIALPKRIMTNVFPADDERLLQESLQQSLQDLALQLGQPIDEEAAEQLYRAARDLLSHLPYTPLTLARVAATLLVYQVQKTDAEEVAWFQTQVQQCPDDAEVEELIESIHRTDAL